MLPDSTNTTQWRKASRNDINQAKRHFEEIDRAHEHLMISLSRGDIVTADTFLMVYAQQVAQALTAMGVRAE